MPKDNRNDQKKINGRFYTPKRLADLLVDNCEKCKAGSRILDPSCGDGSLLKSVRNRFGDAVTCYGCDVSPRPGHLGNLRFKQTDFFDYSVRSKFPLIVTNPPYVRFTLNASNSETWYAKSPHSDLKLDKRSDLWVYFLLKCMDLLDEGGEIAAILPWSFFFTEYAVAIRSTIAKQFKRIVVRVVSEACFSDTPQKVVLLWLKNYGKECEKLEIGYSSGEGRRDGRLVDVPIASWLDGSCMRRVAWVDVAHKDVCKMEDVSTIRIGTVPGSTDFFVWERDDAKRKSRHLRDFVPIVTTSRDVVALRTSTLPPDRYRFLLRLNNANAPRYKAEIAEGERKGCNLPSHCARRNPWYSVPIIAEGERGAFFTYRVASLPMLILNDGGFCCTNSLHYVAFKAGVTEEKKRWIQISLMSVLSLVDIEYHSRVYGSNVLKVEPSALKRVRVYCPEEALPEGRYDEISRLVEQGERGRAIVAASSCVFNAMHLSKKVIRALCCAYNQLRQQRMGKGCELNFGDLYRSLNSQ